MPADPVTIFPGIKRIPTRLRSHAIDVSRMSAAPALSGFTVSLHGFAIGAGGGRLRPRSACTCRGEF